MENIDGFHYTYSASQQQEVANIRNKYLPKEETKMEQLRRLHHSAGNKAKAWSIAIGVIGTLTMGAGMSICMTELGAALGNIAMVIGVLVGIAGMLIVALAYPVYNRVLKKERARIATEILQLSDELLN